MELVREYEISNKKFSRFIGASLLLHLLLLVFLNSPLKDWMSQNQVAQSTTVTIELAPPHERIKQQVVETDLSRKTEQATDDAYLGAQNQIVDRQTRASQVATFKSGRVGGAQTKSAEQKEAKKDTSLSKIGLARDYRPTGHIAPGETASTNDYLKDVKEGSQTMLNTKEFAYFSFYQRVRQQLEQFWEPTLQDRLEKMIARGRTIASDREHNTKLMVIMNPKGEITKIKIENTSGFVDLDDVAVQAFNKAGPFPNPPKGMVEADGTVRVEWEFVLRT